MNNHLLNASLIDGRYRLESPLGVGAFGAVYRATQLVLGEPMREVALKLFHHSTITAANVAQKRVVRHQRSICQMSCADLRKLQSARLLRRAIQRLDDGPVHGVAMNLDIFALVIFSQRLQLQQQIAPGLLRGFRL